MRADLKIEKSMLMLLCTRAVRRFIFTVIYYEMFDMETSVGEMHANETFKLL